MKTSSFLRTILPIAGILLHLTTLCSHSHAAAGNVDLSFDPGSGVNGSVNAVAVQPDGKVIIGGDFTTVKGLARPGLARLNADGSGDATFNPGPNSAGAFALQPDGKLIVCRQSTNGNGYAVRLNSDGTLDGSFVAAPGSYPYGSSFGRVVVQPDGKALLGGSYTDVYIDFDGNWWYYSLYLVVRLNANGTSDTSFAPFSGGDYYTYNDTYLTVVALQSDGKVLIGTTYWASRIVRLNANGSPDSTLNPGTGPNDFLTSVVVQADGKVLIGGYFSAVNGTNRNGIARLNANGSLDSSFNPGVGGAYPIISSIGLQSDGKVLICGYFTQVSGTSRHGIARLNANGSLDSSFDPGTGANYVYSFGLQPDGKVLIGGFFPTVNGANRTNIARLNTNGSLDSSFDPGSGITTYPYTSEQAVMAVAVQPDGKALIGGYFTTVNGTNRSGIARRNANGTLDSSFDPGTGLTNTSNGYEYRAGVSSIVLQPDGKALIGGYFTAVNGTNRNGIARLNANGSLDLSFDSGTGAKYVDSVGLQPDGKVLIGGFFPTVDGANGNNIARLNTNGSLDSSFLPDTGVAGYTINAVAVQSDGKVLIGGRFTTDTATNPSPARLNADGSLDSSFNPGTAANDIIYSIAVQTSGKVLIGGGVTDVNGKNRNGIARFNADGTLDNSFNPGSGVADGDSYPAVRSIAVQPDGKVLIGGNFSAVNGATRNSIGRLNANGSLDTSFDPGTGANGRVSSIALQPDGNLLIGGEFTTVNGVVRPNIARLYGDLSPPPVSFAGWAAGFGLSGASAAADADPDFDGLPNAAEYVLGGNPTLPATSKAPSISLATGSMILTFPRVDASELLGITVSVESSTDLINWPQVYVIGPTTAASSPGVSIIENGTVADTITVAIPIGNDSRKFVRLKVTVAP